MEEEYECSRCGGIHPRKKTKGPSRFMGEFSRKESRGSDLEVRFSRLCPSCERLLVRTLFPFPI